MHRAWPTNAASWRELTLTRACGVRATRQERDCSCFHVSSADATGALIERERLLGEVKGERGASGVVGTGRGGAGKGRSGEGEGRTGRRKEEEEGGDAPSHETLVHWSTSVRSDELFSRPSLSVCAPSFVSPLQPRFSVSIDADTDYSTRLHAIRVQYEYIAQL